MKVSFLISLALLCVLASGAAWGADDVKSVAVPARFLLWDAGSRRIYATVPASATTAGSRANTVTVINPDTGEIVSSAFVGPEPGRMALSLSGKYLFIALDGANAIRVYDIAKQAAGPLISLDPGLTAADLSAVPGFPDSVAVERQNRGFSPSDNGVMIYNADGTARKNVVNAGHSLIYDPLTDRMYGFENEISSYGIRTMTADKDGPVSVDYAEGALIGNTRLVSMQNGLLFSDSANVVDPLTRTKIGQYPGYGYGAILAPDALTEKVYFAEGERGGVKLTAFDMFKFTPAGTTVIPGTGDLNPALIRWGDEGLAFSTSNGRVWLVKSSLVGPKKTPVDLAVSATGLPETFAASATVTCKITVTNQATIPATGVVLYDQLSPNVEIVNVSGSVGMATAANGVARLEVGDLAPKARAILTVQIRLKPQDPNQEMPLTSVTQAVFARSHERDSAPATNHVAQTARLATSGPAAAVAGVDLTGSWKALSQNSEGAGEDLQATLEGEFEVKNIGTETAAPTRLRFFLSADPVYDPGASQLLQEIAVPELKPGATYKAVLKARLRKGDDAIGLFVIANVNATATVAESNKKNNIVPSGAVP